MSKPQKKQITPAQLRKAIHQFGGPTRFAEAMCAAGVEITQSAISQWFKVPANRVMLVSRLLNLPPGRLRPDVFSQSETLISASNDGMQQPIGINAYSPHNRQGKGVAP